MTCKRCGRNDGHYIGCPAVQQDETHVHTPEQLADFAASLCEYEGCGRLKKEWSGRGAKPKFCAAGHKKEK